MMSRRQLAAISSLVAVLTLLAAACPVAAEEGPFGPPTVPCNDGSDQAFKLSLDYPKILPKESYPWEKIDFKENQEKQMEYLGAVLRYVYDGNLKKDMEWQPEKNSKRRWYHVPWLHLGDRGRECLHGMTRERDSRPRELDPEEQLSRFQNWGVAMYNPAGGYTIGQVWHTGLPDLSKARFPTGTVAVKLLFTEADDQQVPFLRGTFKWKGMIHAPGLNVKNERQEKMLRLLQLDIAVRDSRANEETGWVFGTFVYDKGAEFDDNSWRKTVPDPWDKMVPVGLMWGNDPDVTLRDVERSKGRKEGDKEKSKEKAARLLQETFINPKFETSHFLGWGGRLNGPADNPIASCLSCHATAEFPQRSPMAPPIDRWFRNIKAGVPFDLGAASLDYSLQLAQSVLSFCGQESLSDEKKEHCMAAELGPESGVLPSRYDPKQGLPVSRDEAVLTEEDLARQRSGGRISIFAASIFAGVFFLLGFIIGGGGTATIYFYRRKARGVIPAAPPPSTAAETPPPATGKPAPR
ncbi:MAG TPA: hypothetical protein VF756_11750 [Thermoanaerobaculia bacterium]